MMIDPVALTADLVRCKSVTPNEGGALVLLDTMLVKAGFETFRVDRGGVANLFARWGPKGHEKTLGFNGHTDVVPVGAREAWTKDPFGGEIEDGWLYGRGATDMKSGVAAFATAAIDFVAHHQFDGAVIMAITGDEEGDAADGTVALLDWMNDQKEHMTHCIVGEPTNPEHMGDAIKIGRRGSLSAWFIATGKQGHTAYPDRAKNPLTALVRLADRLATHPLDNGSQHFDPSTLALTSLDTGNTVTNVIPETARLTLNIRFNDLHSGQTLRHWLEGEAAKLSAETGIEITVTCKISGESFFTPPGAFTELVAKAVARETNRYPLLSTSGGTSDARFVKDHCPVVECGLVGHRMHGIDERVRVEHIQQLKAVYTTVLMEYFSV